ncbi:hypothetical protein BDF19DRAFT_415394 [Syncephalis fuscata]|nr:hypothetical protein BDF19DRAFT_415394 [Syncephalis fuscata]
MDRPITKATATLREKILQLSLQTNNIYSNQTAPLSKVLANHQRQLTTCIAQECALFNNVDVTRGQVLSISSDRSNKNLLSGSLLNNRIKTDPAILELYNATHFKTYQTFDSLPIHLGDLSAKVIMQQAMTKEQRQIVSHLEQSTQLHTNTIQQMPLLKPVTIPNSITEHKVCHPMASLLADVIHQDDRTQKEHLKNQLSNALENIQQSEALGSSINELYASRCISITNNYQYYEYKYNISKLFYSGKLADHWLRIQGHRFNELVHDHPTTVEQHRK